jgi:hypothetical protein
VSMGEASVDYWGHCWTPYTWYILNVSTKCTASYNLLQWNL